MSSRTVITDALGHTTVIEAKKTNFGCLGWFALFLIVGLPGTWPAPWNIVGWTITGLILVAGLAVKLGDLVPSKPSRPAVGPTAPAAALQAPGTGAAPPAWFPDPCGRHQQRYWDGLTWTAHVTDSGVPGSDPPTVGAS